MAADQSETTLMASKKKSNKVKLLAGVLAMQLCMAGFHVVSRAALNMGVSKIVFPVYRNIIALALLIPFAYFLEKKARPRLTLTMLGQFFLLAFFGITCNQAFYLLGLNYLSPTYASAIQNTVPAITFAMAACLRLERVSLNKSYGIAKVIGTVVSFGGATVITLYKGLPLPLHGDQLHRPSPINSSADAGHAVMTSTYPIMEWTLGCLFSICHCLAWSGWMVAQVPVLKKYPARLSGLALTLAFGLVQLLIIAAAIENDVEKWKIQSGEEIFAILYAGLVASGVTLSLQIWCIDRGGPLFTASFQPIQTVMVALMAAVILGDQLYTGGIIGSVLIVVGLYLVLWGKSEETKERSAESQEDKLALADDGLTSHLITQQAASPSSVTQDP